MNVVVWLSIGALVGWVASYVMSRRRETMKTLLNITAGAGGSLVAGVMVNSLGDVLGATSSAVKMGELLVCFGTAVLLLTLIAEMRHRGRDYHRILPESL